MYVTYACRRYLNINSVKIIGNQRSRFELQKGLRDAWYIMLVTYKVHDRTTLRVTMIHHSVTDTVALFPRIHFAILADNNEEKPGRTKRFADLSHTHATNKPVLHIHLLPIHSIAHFNQIDRESYRRSLI